ncbi:DUF3015 family protein [Silvanigrella aquatica]|uniref:DUF3015 domain-containing protein n=1 Tax=Silvanigrella aquatica TaxID=1915309 RepID=A0A1L4CWV3_9BACT|nr:DUF3015 family protein [Silvanigrella aquatica]APJ02433.1 hypothetical protein AXG55_00160 [Silvanigrella aquatica]
MKLKKLIQNSLIGFVFMSTFYSNSWAENPFAKKGDYKDMDQWGMGGCGLASLFIKEKDMLPQIAASFVNGISGSTQSSAITTGSSNCVASRNDLAAKEQEVFITVNLSSLSKEAAQGSGDHISALAEVFGCPNEQFAKLSQTKYQQIYSQNEPTVVLKNYLKEVKSDQNLSKICLRII